MVLATPAAKASPPLPPPTVRDRRGWPWDDLSAEPSPVRPDEPAWPRISIVIPSFNQGGYLEEALRSVLLQGYPKIELLVIDGGSSDRSHEILGRYVPWLAYWVSEPDQGQSDAINKGLARATGELVTFIGSDDLYLPGAFSEMARLWLANRHAGCLSGAFCFMDPNSSIQSRAILPRVPSSEPLDLALASPRTWRLHQVSTLYSAHALDEVGRHVRVDLRYTMDRELLYRVARRFPISTTDQVVAAFRRHPESKSVAEVLPFCREMARLHLEPTSPHEPSSVARRRQRLARYWLAKAQLKLAAASSDRTALLPLVRAALWRPSLLFERGYLRSWLKALLLDGPLRRFRGPTSTSARAAARETPPLVPQDVRRSQP